MSVLTVFWRFYVHLELKIWFCSTHKRYVQIPIRSQREVNFCTVAISGQETYTKIVPPGRYLKRNRDAWLTFNEAPSVEGIRKSHEKDSYPVKSKALISMCCRTSSDVIWGSTAKERNSTGRHPSHFWKTRVWNTVVSYKGKYHIEDFGRSFSLFWLLIMGTFKDPSSPNMREQQQQWL